jgi:hypothetical protein
MSSRAFTLHAAEPAPITKTVQSFDGTTIYYDLYDNASRGAVLVVPGFWRFRRHASMKALAAVGRREFSWPIFTSISQSFR